MDTRAYSGEYVPNAPLQLTQRECDQIRACQAYAAAHAASGLPGHGLFLLVAKLSTQLEDAVSRFGYAPGMAPPVKIQKVAWSGPHDETGCWRDLVTGVRVDLHD
jgi:hypothetical protein